MLRLPKFNLFEGRGLFGLLSRTRSLLRAAATLCVRICRAAVNQNIKINRSSEVILHEK